MKSTRLILALITAVFLATAACDVAPPDITDQSPVVRVDPNQLDGDTATVTRIIDGDTIDVDINGQEYRVRYIGIDTPERDEFFYDEATAANRQLVDGRTLILVKDVSETDRYGRLLRYLYLTDGTFVNAELIRQGYAQLVTYPPDVAEQDRFRQLQTQAREAGAGLWGLTTPEP